MSRALIQGRTLRGFLLIAVLRKIVFSRVVLITYVVVGGFVANSHHYFAHLDSIKHVASAVLAVFLWPLVLLGVNLRIR
jgi:hypothetical protein